MKLRFQDLFLYHVCILMLPVINSKLDLDSFCATELDEKAWPIPRSMNGKQIEYFGDLSIKLIVYYDNYLFKLHKRNRTSIETFINRTVSSISLTFKHKEIQRVAKINFWLKNILPFNESNIRIPNEASDYLNTFCEITERDEGGVTIRSLFTGYDLGNNDTETTESLSRTLGIAKFKSICSNNACSLVEATYYKAAMISVHEIGHILGMGHDVVNVLTIMHPSAGKGKTKWSQKSVTEMKLFFNELKNEKKWCLKEGTETNIEIVSLDMKEQCRQMFGPEFQVYHDARPPFNSICQLFWCRNGPFVMRGHMALENTECAAIGNSYCYAGQCVRGTPLN